MRQSAYRIEAEDIWVFALTKLNSASWRMADEPFFPSIEKSRLIPSSYRVQKVSFPHRVDRLDWLGSIQI